MEGVAGRTTSAPHSIKVGLCLDICGTSCSIAGEKIVVLEGWRCCEVFQVIIETLDSSLGVMEAMCGFSAEE